MWNKNKRQTLLLAKTAIGKPNAVGFDELGRRRLMGAVDHLSFHRVVCGRGVPGTKAPLAEAKSPPHLVHRVGDSSLTTDFSFF